MSVIDLTDGSCVRTALERVLRLEAEAVANAASHIDARWVEAVHLLAGCRGRVVLFGLGKTGHVARKIAATMASLGTPACFVHAAEAAHGDLGMITKDDVVLAISNSGETTEVVERLREIADIGAPVIALTRSDCSTLGRAAQVCLSLPVDSEADHLNLAPTVSSTLALAAGDALAVAVAEQRGFTVADFGCRHPGGSLGRVTAAQLGSEARS